MELWKSPLKGRQTTRGDHLAGGVTVRVLHDASTGEPLRDRFGRVVESEAADGRLMVFGDDGCLMATGLVDFGELRINMYTGETFRAGIRTRRAVVGPRSGGSWPVKEQGQ